MTPDPSEFWCQHFVPDPDGSNMLVECEGPAAEFHVHRVSRHVMSRCPSHPLDPVPGWEVLGLDEYLVCQVMKS